MRTIRWSTETQGYNQNDGTRLENCWTKHAAYDVHGDIQRTKGALIADIRPVGARYYIHYNMRAGKGKRRWFDTIEQAKAYIEQLIAKHAM